MARNVFAILEDLGEGIAELKAALTPLASLSGGDGPFPVRRARKPKTVRRARRGRKPSASRASRPRKPVSAAVKAKRVLQGRYMAAIRTLSKAQRAKVKKIQAEKGHVAAIKAATSLRDTPKK